MLFRSIPTPAAAAIMSISLDHTAWLGDTVEQIALEKSGIIKRNGRVVLYPEQQYGVTEIIEGICAERGAELRIPDIRQTQVWTEGVDGTDFVMGGIKLHTPFMGWHQINNAAVALELVKVLREQGFNISEENLAAGFKKAFIPARMELLSERPLCLLDGGHNPGCAQALREALERLVPGKKTAVIGMLADRSEEHTSELQSH